MKGLRMSFFSLITCSCGRKFKNASEVRSHIEEIERLEGTMNDHPLSMPVPRIFEEIEKAERRLWRARLAAWVAMFSSLVNGCVIDRLDRRLDQVEAEANDLDYQTQKKGVKEDGSGEAEVPVR